MLLVVGEALVLGAPGDPADPRQTTVQPSGAPAIVAYVAARLGVPTAFVGGVGADAHGDLLRDVLTGAGVDVSGLRTVPDRATAYGDVSYAADGSRAFAFTVTGSAATALTESDLGDLPERASWLHVSGSALLFGEPLAGTVEAAAARAVAANATLSVDPNLRPELADEAAHARLRALGERADVLFPSDDELAGLGLDGSGLAAGGAVVVRTMAAAGAAVTTGAGTVRVPAATPPGPVVDPDGAGDSYAAAWIAAYRGGADPVAAARTAAAVVARAITVPGPMTFRP